MLYVLDSNVVIDLLGGNKAVARALAEAAKTAAVKISDITYYEVLRGFKLHDDAQKSAVFEAFCAAFGIEYQSEDSLRIAAENYAMLRKNGMLIEDDDILIGSLAIAKNAVLVTSNTKHLSRLPGIMLESWA